MRSGPVMVAGSPASDAEMPVALKAAPVALPLTQLRAALHDGHRPRR
jgi:hypothetical protein